MIVNMAGENNSVDEYTIEYFDFVPKNHLVLSTDKGMHHR
jgi:hypothetical protein